MFFESVAKTKFHERSGGFLETIGVNGFFDLVIETLPPQGEKTVLNNNSIY